VPEEAFLAAVDTLVAADRDWLPTGPDQSLYLRPYQLATEPFLGVRPAHEYLFIVIASPAGAYFPRGVHPVSVYLSEDYIRAAPGGTGDVKCAGNYAASLLAQEQAHAAGCDQVVWLDAVERRHVEEMGGMNLFFVLGEGDDAELVTPELTGTLLPGITRASLITLARELGHQVTERQFSVEEWRAGVADGTVTETFACGTAAVITPVGHVKARTGDFTVGGGVPGPLTMRLRAHLLDIQHGRVPDTHGWLHRVL
jgi:branched-chain amino acid aminotransferase